MKLYKVTLSGQFIFMIAAVDMNTAAELAESAWADWGYYHEYSIAVKVTLCAEPGKFRTKIDGKEVPCLIIQKGK